MGIPGNLQAPWNFLGLEGRASLAENSRAWVLPVPYEATTSYGAGTRRGPAAIIEASRQVELFDRHYGNEPALEYGVYTLPPLGLEHDSPAAMVGGVKDTVAEILGKDPRPGVLAVLGGEHSLSAGVARGLALATGSADLVCVQVDAHADLRDEYEGSGYSHACAARRILDTCPVFQIGIRNISAAEEPFRRSCDRVHTVFAEEATAAEPAFLKDLATFVAGRRVFLTIDLDGLDPGIMPAVGTPEPEGLSYARLLEVVATVVRASNAIPVFDVVELAPIAGFHAPDFLAARLVYQILTWILMGFPADARPGQPS